MLPTPKGGGARRRGAGFSPDISLVVPTPGTDTVRAGLATILTARRRSTYSHRHLADAQSDG